MKKAVLLLAFVLFVATLALFAWDAELDAGPRAWLDADLSQAPVTDNGYYALLGLFAPPDVDPAAAGRAQVRRHRVAVAHPTVNSLQDRGHSDPVTPSVVVGTNSLCLVEVEQCLGYLQREADTVRSLVLANQPWVDRYRRLYAYPRFVTAAEPGPGEPQLPLGDLFELHRLIIMEIGLEFLTRSRMRALDGLKTDIDFQRRLLVNADSFELKMAARKMFSRDVLLYAQLIDSRSYIHRHLPTFDVQLQDLSDVERSLAKATKREFRRVASTLMTANESGAIAHESALPARVVRAVYKPNATVNMSYAYFERVINLTALDSEEFAHGWPYEIRVQRSAWDYVCNPVGSLLSDIVAPSLEEQVMALHDTDGLLRMVRLKKRIRAAEIAAEFIPEFLEEQSPVLHAPYDGMAFAWDVQHSHLYFDGPKGSRQTHRSLKIPFEPAQGALPL